jgi:hypothetical protein
MSVYSSGPIGLQLRPILLRRLNSLGTTTSLSSLSKARVYYILARPRQSITVYLLFFFSYILTVPYILSLVDYYYIRLASPPRAIEGVRGIYL